MSGGSVKCWMCGGWFDAETLVEVHVSQSSGLESSSMVCRRCARGISRVGQLDVMVGGERATLRVERRRDEAAREALGW